MRISAAFPSQYLKAADLQQRRVTVQMSHVMMEDIGGEMKPILYFVGKEKGLVLNKTNANTIVMAYGDDTEYWRDQPLEMFEAMVDFQGRTVAAIRVHAPRRQPAAPPPRQEPNGHHPNPSEVPVGTIVDDEIPF